MSLSRRPDRTRGRGQWRPVLLTPNPFQQKPVASIGMGAPITMVSLSLLSEPYPTPPVSECLLARFGPWPRHPASRQLSSVRQRRVTVLHHVESWQVPPVGFD